MNQNVALAEKVVYAAIGAPLVTGRKIINLGGKVADTATDRLETWASEGKKATEKWGADSKKVADQVRTGQVVEDLTARMDLDQIQDRVGKLRDQLEGVLTNWRESFSPESATKTSAAKTATPAKKAPVAKKATPAKKAPVAKKATPAKKAPVAKKATPAKKAPVAKKATPAKKAPVAKKATPAKKAPVAKKATPATKAMASASK